MIGINVSLFGAVPGLSTLQFDRLDTVDTVDLITCRERGSGERQVVS